MTPEDLDFLVGEDGRRLTALAGSLDWSPAARVASTAAVRAADAEHAAAAVDLVTSRARARGRIRGAESMLLTDEAVQQATAWPVAAARAARLAGRDVHDLTCSVGAELNELVRCEGMGAVSGSDLDPLRARMAALNVPAATVGVGDALAPPAGDAVLLADPARRTGGRRVHDPAALAPPLPELLAVTAGRDVAIKCAPGLDTSVLDHDGEVELVSLDGGVREACLWSASLAGGVGRRATILRTVGGPSGVEDAAAIRSETVTDLDPDDAEPDPEADAMIVDPDGAVVRAGLVRHWARRHGLRQLDPRVAHLTGPRIPEGYTGFDVLARHRVDRRELRRALRELDCGSLEILVRGVDVDPDGLRRSLAPKGSRPLALVVTRIGRAGVAFVCGPRRGPDQSDGAR